MDFFRSLHFISMYKLTLAALLLLSLNTLTSAAPAACSYVLVHDPSRANIYIPQQQCSGAEQVAKIQQPGCTSPDNCPAVAKRGLLDLQETGNSEPAAQNHRYMLSPLPPPGAVPEEAPEVDEKEEGKDDQEEGDETPSTPSAPANEPSESGEDEDQSTPPGQSSPAPNSPSPAPFSGEPNLPDASSPSKELTKSAVSSKKKPEPTPIIYKSGLTVTLENAQNFCLFLPSSPGNKDGNGGQYDRDAIGSSEKNARAFCTNQNLAPGAGRMPPGFITSAEFKSTDEYVQIFGTINNAAYHLSNEDGGGQYDDHGSGSPPESHCKNYPYYVSLVEPNINRFCIRCCKSYAQCNAGRSEYGCTSVLRDR